MKGVALMVYGAMLVAPMFAQNRPAVIPQDQWQQAVQLARSGRHRESLDRFKHLLTGSPDENVIRNAGRTLQSADLYQAAQQVTKARG